MKPQTVKSENQNQEFAKSLKFGKFIKLNINI